METQDQIIARLTQENEALKAKSTRRGELSLSPKGCIMFQPKGRKGWPITLYAADWSVVFARQDEIKKFISENVK